MRLRLTITEYEPTMGVVQAPIPTSKVYRRISSKIRRRARDLFDCEMKRSGPRPSFTSRSGLLATYWNSASTGPRQSAVTIAPESRLFFHSGDVLHVILLVMTVQRWPDTEKELERVTEIVAVIAIQRIGAVVDGELGAETDVDTFAM